MRSWNCPWMSPQMVTGALTLVTFLQNYQQADSLALCTSLEDIPFLQQNSRPLSPDHSISSCPCVRRPSQVRMRRLSRRKRTSASGIGRHARSCSMCLSKSLIFYSAPHGAAICLGVVSLCAGWCSHAVEAPWQDWKVYRSVGVIARDSYTLDGPGRRIWKGRRWVYRVCRMVNLQFA
jgi:hypothetical protein